MLMMEVDSDGGVRSRKNITNTLTLGKSASSSQLLQCSFANWFRNSQMEYLCKYKRLFLYTLLVDYSVIGQYLEINSSFVFLFCLHFHPSLRKSPLIKLWFGSQNPFQTLQIGDEPQIFSYSNTHPMPHSPPSLFSQELILISLLWLLLFVCCERNSLLLRQHVLSHSFVFSGGICLLIIQLLVLVFHLGTSQGTSSFHVAASSC